jgi:geranylgeranyl reductase family protein
LESFDAIIIGAGPAGAMAARECSRQGLRAVLIEKEKLPRPKLCGGGVTLKAMNLVGEMIPEHVIESYVRGFRIYSDSMDSVEFVSRDPIAISTCRDKFDEFLTELAVREGCELIEPDGVVDVSVQSDEVVCRLQSGRLVRANLVIGADGVNSTTARETGIRRRWRKGELALCLETTIMLNQTAMKRIDPEVFELYFDDDLLGYKWLIPKRAAISIGVGGLLPLIHGPQDILEDFSQTLSKLKEIDIRISHFGAHLVPAVGFVREVVSNRVILVGDAAGCVDPLMGEGIYYAMKSGILAAAACRKAIDERNTDSSFLREAYAKECMKEFGKDLKVALDLRYRVYNDFDTFFGLLENHSAPMLAEVTCGKINYRVLRRKVFLLLAARFVESKVRGLLQGQFLDRPYARVLT